jgi:microcystin-dependent protein
MSTASVSYLFVDDTDAEASEVNRNFTDLTDFLNNNVIHRDGTTAMAGAFDAGSNKIVNLTSGTAATDAVNKTQLDAVAASVTALSGTVSGVGQVPVGAGMEWYSNTIPSKWLLQDGSAVSRTTYAALFAVIGVTWGAGDGVTTFNLPNRQDRFGIGVGAATLNNTLGETGGSRDLVVVGHQHEVNPPSTDVTFGGLASKLVQTGTSGTTVDIGVDAGTFQYVSSYDGTASVNIAAFQSSAFGETGVDKNLPPFVAVNYIIYAGV